MKRLIICYDGTWNTADNKGTPSNVVRFARMIGPSDTKGVSQVVYYDPGVGTGNFVDRIVGGTFGDGLEQKVKEGYLFLAHNYEKGDEIYVFGFSRGAFTARSLVGFIGACGGLLAGERGLNKLEAAWDYYRVPPAKRSEYEFHVEIDQLIDKSVDIHCLGVWDTVGALGIPSNLFNQVNKLRYSFHDTKLSKIVKCAFQALAIDEHRGPFVASLWQKPNPPIKDQVVEQVWFPGVHANIGGGYLNTYISDLTLRWMMARVVTHTRLQFDPKEIAYFLPEIADPKLLHRPMPDAIDHLKAKAKGELYDSLSWYLVSRLWPRIRTLNNQLPHLGTGPIRRFFRTSARSPEGSFQEAVHWSVVWRHESGKREGLPNYDPPNLRVILDDLKAARLTEVQFADELKPGVPYQK